MPMPTIAPASFASTSATAGSSRSATKPNTPTSSSSTTRCSFSIWRSAAACLPPYDVAILDEAHQCERWATDALTATISRGTLGRMMRKLHRTYTLPASFDGEFDEGMRALESALARVPGDRYPLGANEDAWPALETRARDALQARELALRQLALGA